MLLNDCSLFSKDKDVLWNMYAICLSTTNVKCVQATGQRDKTGRWTDNTGIDPRVSDYLLDSYK